MNAIIFQDHHLGNNQELKIIQDLFRKHNLISL